MKTLIIANIQLTLDFQKKNDVPVFKHFFPLNTLELTQKGNNNNHRDQ